MITATTVFNVTPFEASHKASESKKGAHPDPSSPQQQQQQQQAHEEGQPQGQTEESTSNSPPAHHEVFTDVALRQAPISVHVSKGVSARHRIQFNRSPEQAHKEWEEHQLRKHLGPTVRMCLFEHVEGSTVCQGLFKHFTLPNGKTVHYYHEDTLHEIVANTVVKPPRPPLSLRDIFQDRVPLEYTQVTPDHSDIAGREQPRVVQPLKPHDHTLPVDDHVCGGQYCTMYGVLPGGDAIHLTATTEETRAPIEPVRIAVAVAMSWKGGRHNLPAFSPTTTMLCAAV